MNPGTQCLLIVMLLPGLFSDCAQSALANQQDNDPTAQIEFAEKRDLPVITYELTGGFRGKADAAQNAKPRLQIWPSGKLVCGSSSVRLKEVHSQLEPKELQELLDFIVNKQKYFELTDNGIKQNIADAGEKIYISDAPTSRFTINLKRGEHELSVYATKFVAKQIPDLAEMQRVLSIERRLENVIALANVGGNDSVRSILKFVNQGLKQEYPDAKRIMAEDLRSAQQLTDGTLLASFEIELVNKEDDSTARLNARYSRDENEKEEIKFYVFKNRQ